MKMAFKPFTLSHHISRGSIIGLTLTESAAPFGGSPESSIQVCLETDYIHIARATRPKVGLNPLESITLGQTRPRVRGHWHPSVEPQRSQSW